MPGMVLEGILNRVRESDLREFKEKLLPQEEAKEAQMKKDGLMNMSMLVEERKARNAGYNLDYDNMGGGQNVDGEAPNSEALMVPGGEFAKTPETPAEPKSGKEMFDAFLEKLK